MVERTYQKRRIPFKFSYYLRKLARAEGDGRRVISYSQLIRHQEDQGIKSKLKKPDKVYDEQISSFDRDKEMIINSIPSYRSIYSYGPSRRATQEMYFESDLPASNKDPAFSISAKRNTIQAQQQQQHLAPSERAVGRFSQQNNPLVSSLSRFFQNIPRVQSSSYSSGTSYRSFDEHSISSETATIMYVDQSEYERCFNESQSSASGSSSRRNVFERLTTNNA